MITEYVAPQSIDDLLIAITNAGKNGKLLAGGQSLIPSFQAWQSQPIKIIDLGRVEVLRQISSEANTIIIGAMVTLSSILRSDLISQHARLLCEAVSAVADPQVRNWATLGGSLAHANPASDVGAAALALGVELVIMSPNGRTRKVRVENFFEGPFQTKLGEGELLTHIHIPKRTEWGACYEKFVRVAHQWATVGVAATVIVRQGVISEALISLANMGPTPVRAATVEKALVGRVLTKDLVACAALSVSDGTEPLSDLNGDFAYRMHLAKVLTRRAVLKAASECSRQS